MLYVLYYTCPTMRTKLPIRRTNIRIREAKFHMSLAVLLQVEVVPERETLTTTTPSSSTRIHLFLTNSVRASGSRILYSTSYVWTSKSMDQWRIEYVCHSELKNCFFIGLCQKVQLSIKGSEPKKLG